MTRSQRAAVLRGAASLAALLTLVVGPPLVLAGLVGWPLPTELPNFDDISNALQLGIDDRTVVKAIALVAWVAWSQVALAVLIEVVGAVRSRGARRLPIAPGIQAGASRLVASVVFAVSSFGPTHAGVGALPAPSSAPVAAVVAERQPRPSPELAPAAAAAPVASSAEAPAPTVEVRRHDSYWRLAERCLGDGLRWREVHDLNVGRTMPDGHTITAGSNLLRPGWVLVLPADAAVDAPNAAPPPARSAAAGMVTVMAGDDLWTIAERQVADALGRPPTDAEVGPYWSALVDTNEATLEDTSLVHPGQHLVLPPPPAAPAPSPEPQPAEPPAATPSEPGADLAPSPPSSPAPDPDADPDPDPDEPTATTSIPPDADSATGSPPAGEQPSAQPASDAAADEDHDTEDESLPAAASAGLAAACATLLAVGVTRAVRRARRRRAHNRPDAPTAPTPEAHRPVHRALVTNADDAGVEALRSALDDLAARVAARGATSRPRVVRQTDDEIEVLVDDPVDPPPEGWAAEADGAIWARATAVNTSTPSWVVGGTGSAAPLLVTLGEPEDGGQLYLDLETTGHVCLTGDEDVALAVARAIVLGLVHSPLASLVQVVVTGDLGLPPLRNVERLRTVDDRHHLADSLQAWADQSRQAMADNGWPNPFVARGCGADHDALVPMVAVVVGDGNDDGIDLDALVAGHAAAALLTVGTPVAGALAIVCDTDRLEVPALRLVCTPRPATTEDVETIDALLDESAEVTGPPSSNGSTPAVHYAPPLEVEEVFTLWDESNEPDPPGRCAPLAAEEDDDFDDAAMGSGEAEATTPTVAGEAFQADAEYEDPAYDVLVRLLGDITVEGGSQSLTPKQTAVVSYIALHGPAGIDRVADAVWSAPTTGSRRKRLANTVSDCRSVLGAQHLPIASDGRYRTGPDVITDLDLFERRVEAAAAQPPELAVSTLRGAMALVDGPVFTYPSTEDAFAWVDLENWVSTWELTVASVAQHLGEMYLDLGQPDDAVAVAHQALRVVPTHPGLTETLMRAHAANGEHLAVQRVYASLVSALDQLDLDAPAESTRSVFEDLRTGSH